MEIQKTNQTKKKTTQAISLGNVQNTCIPILIKTSYVWNPEIQPLYY